MLTYQNKALFIILINQNKVLCMKLKQSSENSSENVFFRDSCKAHIFSNIQLIKNKFGNNIDGHMKERS